MRILHIAAVIILSLTLQGCFAAAAVTAAEAGKTIAQKRSMGSRIDDNGIALKVNDAFLQADVENLFSDISTTIFEGRVLLTGAVKKPEYAERAENLVWNVKGVVEVINEVQVTQADFVDYSKDVYLANAVRGKLLLTKGIASSNFMTSCVNGKIYLMGVAKDETERQNAVEVARRVQGVVEVISHVILANDPRRQKWADA